MSVAGISLKVIFYFLCNRKGMAKPDEMGDFRGPVQPGTTGGL